MSNPSARPKVVLSVDDHPLIRSSLREVLLTSGPVELLEASDPAAGLALLRSRGDVDLIFLDLHFSAHDGVAFIGEFRAAAPAAPVIVYTMREDLASLSEALARGALGVVPKTHSREALHAAIEVVMQGGVYLPVPLARQLAAREAESAAPAPVAMSDQQWRILSLLERGLPNKEIARKLGIASSTVKNQLTVVFDKLAVNNRTQAAIAARMLLKAGGEARTQ
jgi:DNA-binding NarL/FixJ family response regulator